MTQAKAQNRIGIKKKPDQSLPRSKILRGKLHFQRLFERSTILRQSSLLCRYRIYSNPNTGCMFGFIAPKKIFRRATDRNRAKRILRETFRTNQHLLPEIVKNNEIGFHAVFIANGKDLSFSSIQEQMVSLLKALSNSLTSERTSAEINNHHKQD